ncbi:FkbM family methyltransferase [Candidatus Nomurabacteria bacterium]|nr:FkbM family methyltransferase [Candidatus Nomurabacteria bacterium]
MKRFVEIVTQSIQIVTKKHITLTMRLHLLVSYLALVSKRFLSRFGIVDIKTAKFLGYKIEVGLFSDFYWTFVEIFVNEDYYFETDNTSPYIIDCGGNIGMATLYFKWLYPKSRIDIFEIEPKNIFLLRNNIDNNKLVDINIIQKAVSRETGKIQLFGGRRAGTISKTLIDEQIKKDNTYADKEVFVDAIKLSEHITKTVDFLKMDIEGAESGVFQDLEESGELEKVEKTTIEFHRFSSNENRLSVILSALEKYDFDVVFPHNFPNLRSIRRSYYNYMIRAGKRHW